MWWPSHTKYLDFELELAFVLAKPLADATPEEAADAVGGWFVLNDWSARDVQAEDLRENPFGPVVKSKTFANSIGADVLTADELPDWQAARGRVRVDGEVWCEGTTAGAAHDVGAMLAYASAGERLEPGDVISTGTMPGCCGLELDRWIRPGQTVELEIDGIGTLAQPDQRHATPNQVDGPKILYAANRPIGRLFARRRGRAGARPRPLRPGGDRGLGGRLRRGSATPARWSGCRATGCGRWGASTSVRAALRDDELFISGHGVAANPLTNLAARKTTLFSDGETHVARRKVLMRSLGAQALAPISDRLDAEAAAIVAGLVGRGEFDAARDFSSGLPLRVVADLVGVRVSSERLLSWGDDLLRRPRPAQPPRPAGRPQLGSACSPTPSA